MKYTSIAVLALVSNSSAINLNQSWTPQQSRQLFEQQVAEAAKTVATERSIEAQRISATQLLNQNDITQTFNEKARVRAGQIAMQRGGPPSQYGGGHWFPAGKASASLVQKEEGPWNPAKSRKVFEKSMADAAKLVAEERSSENRRVAANRLLDDNDIRETFNEKARVRAGQIAMQRGGPSTQYWNAPPPKKNAGSLAQTFRSDIINEEGVDPNVYKFVDPAIRSYYAQQSQKDIVGETDIDPIVYKFVGPAIASFGQQGQRDIMNETDVDPIVYKFTEPLITSYAQSKRGDTIGTVGIDHDVHKFVEPAIRDYISSVPRQVSLKKDTINEEGVDPRVYKFVDPAIAGIKYSQQPTAQRDIGDKMVDPRVYRFVRPEIEQGPESRSDSPNSANTLTGYSY